MKSLSTTTLRQGRTWSATLSVVVEGWGGEIGKRANVEHTVSGKRDRFIDPT